MTIVNRLPFHEFTRDASVGLFPSLCNTGFTAIRRNLDDIKKYVPEFVPEFIPEFVPVYKSEFRSYSGTNSGMNSGTNSGTYFFKCRLNSP